MLERENSNSHYVFGVMEAQLRERCATPSWALAVPGVKGGGGPVTSGGGLWWRPRRESDAVLPLRSIVGGRPGDSLGGDLRNMWGSAGRVPGSDGTSVD